MAKKNQPTPEESSAEIVKQISGMLSHVTGLIDEQMPYLEGEVNRIISTRSKNSDTIDHLFDSLLTCLHCGRGEDLYMRLLDYYKTVDAEGEAFYRRQLNELND